MNVVINASNLHAGGALQVATSFLVELSELLKKGNVPCDVFVVCSEKVYDSLPSKFDKSGFCAFEIINIFGFSIVSKDVRSRFFGFDVCFTVFGPMYFNVKCGIHICGFAQPWIAYPQDRVYSRLSLMEYVKNKVKYKMQSLFFLCCDYLVVEHAHVESALHDLGYSGVFVVNNCVSSLYEQKSDWIPIDYPVGFVPQGAVLGFVGRFYPHKNVSILKKVNELLVNKYRFFCDFLFTFSEEEMAKCGFCEIDNFYSVGEIKPAQCPFFYARIDALVFPSLLECFSASPLEAMKMKKTVIASNCGFIKEVCGQSAFYFDPLDANDIASTIVKAFADESLREEKKKKGSMIISRLPTAKSRALSYMEIIEKCWNNRAGVTR